MTDTHVPPPELPAAEEGEERPHRRIKSFVMRAGRMTEGQ
ncbi:hypothetical protein APX70_07974, partial [Pseudomonas syringae pv. maculicola]